MEKLSFKTNKTIGTLLITGSILILIPYSILASAFNYPDILREETGSILTQFHQGGRGLIWTWWAFAIVGLPLIEGYVLIGQKLEHRFYFVRWATWVGVTGLLVQMIGLLRWTFVVPVLAQNFVTGNLMTQEATKVAFQVVHQYGGVVLGEHIGQLFTIAWVLMMNTAFMQTRLFPRWVIALGYLAAGIYLLAQTELFATVIRGFPTIAWAGFAGSTLWLLWTISMGVYFWKTDD